MGREMDLFTAWCVSTCNATTVELRLTKSQILHLKRFRSLWNWIWPARWDTNTIGMTNSSLQKGHVFTKIFLLALFSSELKSIGWGDSMLVVELFQCDISIELSQTYIFSSRIHKNEIQETKRSNWFPLNEISEIYFQTVLDSVRMLTVVSVKLAPFCAHTDSNFGTTPKAWSIENWNV